MHMGVRVGSLSEICLTVLLFPILRGMSVFRIFGIEFEAAVRYHTWIANALVLFCTLHGIIIMSIWGQKKKLLAEVNCSKISGKKQKLNLLCETTGSNKTTNRHKEKWKTTDKLNLIPFLELQITSWQRIGRVNVAGAIGLITILIIWISSLPIIRRKCFQTFFMTHHLYIVFITFFLLHAGDKHFYLVLSGILLFALDKIFRLIQSRRETRIVSASVLPCRAVELILPKDPSKLHNTLL